jgi:hypothetical protein
MSAKYTSCRWFECMDRPLELPPLAYCAGQYYEPYAYCGTPINLYPPADVRTVAGECAQAERGGICQDYISVGGSKCGQFRTGSDGKCYAYPSCEGRYPIIVYQDP